MPVVPVILSPFLDTNAGFCGDLHKCTSTPDLPLGRRANTIRVDSDPLKWPVREPMLTDPLLLPRTGKSPLLAHRLSLNVSANQHNVD